MSLPGKSLPCRLRLSIQAEPRAKQDAAAIILAATRRRPYQVQVFQPSVGLTMAKPNASLGKRQSWAAVPKN